MSDDMAAPEMEGTDAPDAETAPEPAAPVKPTPLGARGRPSMRPPGPGPRPHVVSVKLVGKPSKLKGILMLGIIISVVGLSGAIAFKLYKKYFGKEKIVVDVGAEIDKAYGKAEDDRKQIELIEKVVINEGQDLGGAEAVRLQKHLQGLQECTMKFDDLRALMREMALKRQGTEAAEAIAQSSDNEKLAMCDVKVKLWILDADDLLQFSKNAKSEYGGLYIPMFRALDKFRKAQKELTDLREGVQDVINRNDAAEKTKTRTKIEDLKAAFAAVPYKLNGLDTYIKDGLARPELSPKEIKELEELHDQASKAQMSFKEAQRIRLLIPE
jgi:hypothetical protein